MLRGMIANLAARISLIVASALVASAVNAESGVFDDRIVFGQSAALDGPAAELGRGMRDGILAAFNETSQAGGVHGRSLELISYDDGYEPERAIANVSRLIDDDGVFAVIGEVGTPTSSAVQPITTAGSVPFLAPFTGAEFLRDPSLENVVNVRASYDQETEAWIAYLVDQLGLSRIAILYQDDSFGRAGLEGVRDALGIRGQELVAEGTYMRNTTAVKRALLDIRKAAPEAVVIVGAYQPSAEFIRIARDLGLDPVFINISFVGSRALAEALGAAGKGVVVSQVVPLPEDTTIPIVADYRRALAAFDPALEPEFVSLEGYIAGRLTIAALETLGPEVTRQGLLSTIKDMGRFDLGGLELTYGPGDNQGMDEVFLTVLDGDGQFSAIDLSVPTEQAGDSPGVQ
jgi:ABC-type branched-subunit amino acid transport system substrate-binding protein